MNRIMKREGKSAGYWIVESVCGKELINTNPGALPVRNELESFYGSIEQYGYMTGELRKQRELIIKHFIHDESISKIADDYCLSPKTVKMYINRGLQALSKYWWISPYAPISVNSFNKAVIQQTGSVAFLDGLKQIGVARIEDCLDGFGRVNTKLLSSIPYCDVKAFRAFEDYLNREVVDIKCR